MNAAADVIERVARGQSSDPSTDDLTVPLAIECAELRAEIERLRNAHKAIIVRCTEGDKRSDWLPIIANISRRALGEP